MRNVSNIPSEIERVLKLVMLKDSNRRVRYLSGGCKRKLSLGMAIIGESKFVILDEPTSSLDYQSRQQVWNIIKNIAKERSLLITT